ncbi:hypothetical protein JKP88DRAFT_266515 [Tribonema minus]|uniref:Uncharacterized protein n=1 Tax=Tribonema minus TaxID=303371 RepID=A0A835ZDE3_9STRA|nr:hypothetical protein JKP88DRAFT_266515 [Tribonema minus]
MTFGQARMQSPTNIDVFRCPPPVYATGNSTDWRHGGPAPAAHSGHPQIFGDTNAQRHPATDAADTGRAKGSQDQSGATSGAESTPGAITNAGPAEGAPDAAVDVNANAARTQGTPSVGADAAGHARSAAPAGGMPLASGDADSAQPGDGGDGDDNGRKQQAAVQPTSALALLSGFLPKMLEKYSEDKPEECLDKLMIPLLQSTAETQVSEARCRTATTEAAATQSTLAARRADRHDKMDLVKEALASKINERVIIAIISDDPTHTAAPVPAGAGRLDEPAAADAGDDAPEPAAAGGRGNTSQRADVQARGTSRKPAATRARANNAGPAVQVADGGSNRDAPEVPVPEDYPLPAPPAYCAANAIRTYAEYFRYDIPDNTVVFGRLCTKITNKYNERVKKQGVTMRRKFLPEFFEKHMMPVMTDVFETEAAKTDGLVSKRDDTVSQPRRKVARHS